MSQNRRLAAIMVGDIVGFTAEMAIDEAHALSYVRRMRAVAEPLVLRWEGRLIKHIGDGFLVAFDSAVEAVDCAVAIQRALAAEPDFKLRLGVHLGDVLFGDDDVYGDGVNVAARLEMLASPGGICVSQHVWELVRNQTGIAGVLIGLTTIPPGGIEAWAVAGEGMPKPVGRPDASRVEGLAHKVGTMGPRDARAVARRAAPLLLAATAGAALALWGASPGGLLGGWAPWGGAGARADRAVLVADVGVAGAPAPTSAGAVEAEGGAPVDLAARLNRLLADALGAVRGVRVVPPGQVQDDLQLLRERPDQPVDPALALRLARRDPAVDAILQADVEPIGQGFVLRVEVVDPATGGVVAGFRREADGPDGLLGAMGRLLDEVVAGLPRALAGLPERAGAADDAAGRVTTDDDEALADYRAAYAHTLTGDWRAALALAERAAEADPAFAMAHLLAAEAARSLGRDLDGGAALGRAAARADGLSRPAERALVRAAQLRARGACRDAAAALDALAGSAPDVEAAYAHWSLTGREGALACAGRLDDALSGLEARAAVRPGDPWPLAAAVDIRLRLAGDVAGARQAWRRLDRLPGEPAFGMAPLFPAIEPWVNDRTADAAAALSALRAAHEEEDVLPIQAALFQAALAAYDGRFGAAGDAAREAAAVARAREASWLEGYARWQQAEAAALDGDAAEADAIFAALAAEPGDASAGPRALDLLRAARADDPEARRFGVLAAPRLRDRRVAEALGGLVAGEASLAAGNPRDAVAALEDAVAAAPELGFDVVPSWHRPALAYQALAVAYERDGQPDLALATWRHLAERPVQAVASGSIPDVAAHVSALYHVGRLSEAAGDAAAAADATAAFLRRWGEADRPETADARARLDRLGGRP